MRSRIAVLAVTIALAACAPSDAGFSGVRRTVLERSGQRIDWDPDDDLDARVPPAATRLLERPLTATSAAQIAVLNNRRLRAEIESLGVARADLVGASALPNPEIEASARFGGSQHQPELEASLELGLVDLLLMPGRRSAASSTLRAEGLRVAGAVLDLVYRVRRAFLTHQADLQVLALRRVSLATAAASYEAARALHAAGNVDDLALHLQQAQYEEMRVTMAHAEVATVRSRSRLQVLLGVWGTRARFRIAPRLPEPPAGEPDLEHVERRAVERSLDLQASRHRLEAASTRVGVARRAGALPELSAGISVERRDDGTHAGPAVRLTLPLFDQGQGTTGRARAELRQLEERTIALAIEVRAAAADARSQVIAALERARHQRDVLLPLRRAIVDETLLRANAMRAGVFDLLQAKREQVEAERATVEALRDYWIARASLDLVLGGKLPSAGSPSAQDGADAALGRDGEGESETEGESRSASDGAGGGH